MNIFVWKAFLSKIEEEAFDKFIAWPLLFLLCLKIHYLPKYARASHERITEAFFLFDRNYKFQLVHFWFHVTVWIWLCVPNECEWYTVFLRTASFKNNFLNSSQYIKPVLSPPYQVLNSVFCFRMQKFEGRKRSTQLCNPW